MARVTAITQQKGGTGKTTTASALAAGLAHRGKRCLMVDLDAQCNLSFLQGAKEGRDILDFMAAEPGKAADVVQETGKNLYLIPGTLRLANPKLLERDATALKARLAAISGQYDHIIIDTPPALGLLTISALMAADGVIIPTLADVLSIQATAQIGVTIDSIKAAGNNSLKIDGLLLTRYNRRQIITRDLTALIEIAAGQLQTKVFQSRIRDSVAVREAQAMKKDVLDYAPKSTTAQDYRAFLAELLKDWKARKTN